MQDIVEKLKSFAGKTGEGISQGFDVLKDKASQAGEGIGKGLDTLKDTASEAGDYLQANPTIAAMLLAGGGSGLLGGYLTSQQKEDESESKMSRRGRILRNALMSAAAGAGAVGLGVEGYRRLAEATPAGSLNPVQEKLTSPIARGAGAAGVGALGFSAGRKADQADLAEQAFRSLSAKDQRMVRASKYSPQDIITHAEQNYNFKPKANNITDFVSKLRLDLKANINDPKLQKNLAKVLGKSRVAALLMNLHANPKGINSAQKGVDKVLGASRYVINKILGTSRAGQLARVGGAAGLFLPELIGGAKDLMLQND